MTNIKKEDGKIHEIDQEHSWHNVEGDKMMNLSIIKSMRW